MLESKIIRYVCNKIIIIKLSAIVNFVFFHNTLFILDVNDIIVHKLRLDIVRYL